MKKLMSLTLALLMARLWPPAAANPLRRRKSSQEGSAPAETAAFVPEKNITWICTSSAGGGSDIFSRMISDIMKTEDMVNGQTIVVSNETDGPAQIGRNRSLP